LPLKFTAENQATNCHGGKTAYVNWPLVDLCLRKQGAMARHRLSRNEYGNPQLSALYMLRFE
jgi:hypothetical protein